MKELVLASGNKKKINELKELLDGLSVLSLNDIGFDQDIAEPYLTFKENALQKARTVFEYCNKNVLADDSGISVLALNNQPGVFSARYAGENTTDQENLDKLLDEMQGKENRKAFYTAVLCLIWDGVPHYFEGTCHGTLIDESRGSNGFGYDPIFIPNGYSETFGELSSEIKRSISHRAQAMKKLSAFIRERTNS
ncbi:MAG: RdgB/HAM1 family non-canonical purine NTP pyrophosphatase [Chitinophagaceae bacterium]|jgi:XTP/dITP diphosphohydrolase